MIGSFPVLYSSAEPFMATQPQPSAHWIFGPFEVNSATGELRKAGIRIRLSGQPFRILQILLERPGELVAREQLREQLWSDGTFVDFEGGLNAAINKLRRALDDSADRPRYIETVPARGYRFIGKLERPGPIPLSRDEPIPREPRRGMHRWVWVAASLVGLAGAFALGWRIRTRPDSLPDWKLIQLTTGADFGETPALSSDGKLVAYASDGESQGLDLYIKQVAGGQPIRLTFDGAGNTAPDFAPDASKIVFRSNRDGGGIYVIPAFGGEPRLLAREGRDPRFSPDGAQIAYWVGPPDTYSAVPGLGALWVLPAAGGQPRRLGAEFTNARCPIWSPDSKHLLFVGYTSSKAYERSAIDWWLIPVDGGQAIRTNAYDALARAGLDGQTFGKVPPADIAAPGCWVPATNTIIFHTPTGDAWNIWEAVISAQGKVGGAFKRLTAGAGYEVDPSCASSGTFAFTNLEYRTDIWSLNLDLNRGTPNGPLERLTVSDARREQASLTSDGRKVAFASNQAGVLNIWLRDLVTGEELRVTNSPFVQRYPVISPSGSRVAYSSFEKEKRIVYAATPSGTPDKLCEGCLRATDWSRDESRVLICGGAPYEIDVLDIGSRRQTPVLKHPIYSLLYGRFSPDNRWVSFAARVGPNQARIEIASVDGVTPVPESAWIQVAEEGAEDGANWSFDGNTLYFTSSRDGNTCLWGQHLDRLSHRPLGQSFAVQHFHGRRRFFYKQGGWSAAGGHIAVVLRENMGHIWMMSRRGAE
jgi:Tol biopolymer transport system component/DNA-binding winged helix-turn-helix (wHTH) protein